MPEIGQAITVDDMDMMLQAMGERQAKHPDEPAALSMYVVFNGIGDRFTPVQCIEQEWSGVKQDIPKRDEKGEKPKCPNGHPLVQASRVRLGWIQEPDDDEDEEPNQN